MSICIDEYIVRLDISMNVVHFMHVLKSKDELTHIEASLTLREYIFFY
jgi:hypothetical protein